MSISDKLTRLASAKTAIASAIAQKGGTVGSGDGFEDFASDIGSIPTVTTETATFSQVNEIVSRFLSEFTYDPDDYTTSRVQTYRDTSTDYTKGLPSGYALGGTKNLCVMDRSAQKCVLTSNSKVYNLPPGAEGLFYVYDNSGNINRIVRLTPTGALRMIAMPSCMNVRDLGGWTCDGGTVKYGKIFRGSKFVNGLGNIVLADVDKNILKNLLGVRTEIDFQQANEGGARSASALGDDVEYVPAPGVGSGYANMVNLSGSTADLKKALLKAFGCASKGLPLYFHCFYGADRTGTFALILEALLGISQSDIDKDYELTSFYINDTYRPRTSANYTGLINYFYSFGKSNLRDNVAKWALRLGITMAQINAFRAAMIDGTPSQLVADTVTVTNTLTNASTSNTASATGEYEPYSATITPDVGYTLTGATVQVTMDGVDVTASVYANGVITIPQVTGNLAITVAAASSARLPAAYQEVEYIENESTAWIDTGITSKYGVRTKVGASITTHGGYQAVIAAYSSVRDNVGYSGLQSWWAAPNGAAVGTSVTLTRYEKYDIECDRTSSGYLNYGNTSAGTNTYASFTNTVSYGLFARNKGTSHDYLFKGKIYYCEIYDGSTKVADMIPCYRKSDNVAGMYDLVRETFYPSSDSSVNFAKGSNV